MQFRKNASSALPTKNEPDTWADIKPPEFFVDLVAEARRQEPEEAILAEIRLMQEGMSRMDPSARERHREKVLAPMILGAFGHDLADARVRASGLGYRHLAVLVLRCRQWPFQRIAEIFGCTTTAVWKLLDAGLDLLGDPSRRWPCGLAGRDMRAYVRRLAQA